MPFTSTDYDQDSINRAVSLAAVNSTAEAAVWTLANVPGMTQYEIDSRLQHGSIYAGVFGSAQSLLAELAGIIDRQRAEITSLTDAYQRGHGDGYSKGLRDAAPDDDDDGEPLTHVPMACTACGKPVIEATPDGGGWIHVDTGDYLNCPVEDGTPVKARVDA